MRLWLAWSAAEPISPSPRALWNGLKTWRSFAKARPSAGCRVWIARGADSSGTAVLLYAGLLAASTALAGRFHGTAPRPRWVESLHLGWTLIVLPIVFAGIRYLVPAFAGGREFDDELAALDRDWFGVDIPRWSEGFLTPPVADAAMLFYFLYFLMPVAAFAMLVRAGITPAEALRTATINPARYLGMSRVLGTIETGKIADLVLLEANPLEDIDNARKVAAVVANGRYVPVASSSER